MSMSSAIVAAYEAGPVLNLLKRRIRLLLAFVPSANRRQYVCASRAATGPLLGGEECTRRSVAMTTIVKHIALLQAMRVS